MTIDVPSPIDLRLMTDARPWSETALARRPARPEFFDTFARLIGRDGVRVLELGSGPGFLADHLLRRCRISTSSRSTSRPRCTSSPRSASASAPRA